MSTININNGTANSVGNNNNVVGNSIGKSDDIKITTEDIEALKKLSDKLLEYKEDVKVAEIRKASGIIYELAEASEENDFEKQNEAIINWTKFKEKAAGSTMTIVNLASSVITIGTYLKSLLGV